MYVRFYRWLFIYLLFGLRGLSGRLDMMIGSLNSVLNKFSYFNL